MNAFEEGRKARRCFTAVVRVLERNPDGIACSHELQIPLGAAIQNGSGWEALGTDVDLGALRPPAPLMARSEHAGQVARVGTIESLGLESGPESRLSLAVRVNSYGLGATVRKQLDEPGTPVEIDLGYVILGATLVRTGAELAQDLWRISRWRLVDLWLCTRDRRRETWQEGEGDRAIPNPSAVRLAGERLLAAVAEAEPLFPCRCDRQISPAPALCAPCRIRVWAPELEAALAHRKGAIV